MRECRKTASYLKTYFSNKHWVYLWSGNIINLHFVFDRLGMLIILHQGSCSNGDMGDVVSHYFMHQAPTRLDGD